MKYEVYSTKKHGTEIFKDHNDGEELFLHGIMILLSYSQFTRQIRNRSFLLDDYSAHLVDRSISMYV